MDKKNKKFNFELETLEVNSLNYYKFREINIKDD